MFVSQKIPLLSLLAYIDITCQHLPSFTLSSLTVHRFLIAGVCAGSKAQCDVFCTNSHYAKVGGIKVAELNALEREFLRVTQWALCVSDTDTQTESNFLPRNRFFRAAIQIMVGLRAWPMVEPGSRNEWRAANGVADVLQSEPRFASLTRPLSATPICSNDTTPRSSSPTGATPRPHLPKSRPSSPSPDRRASLAAPTRRTCRDRKQELGMPMRTTKSSEAGTCRKMVIWRWSRKEQKWDVGITRWRNPEPVDGHVEELTEGKGD